MGKIKQYWLITGLVIVAVLGAGYFFGAKPQAAKAKKVKAATALQFVDNASLQVEIKRLQKQADGLIAQQNRLRQIAGIIPTNPGLPKLVRSLSAVTGSAGVELTTLSPGALTPVADAVAAVPPAREVDGADAKAAGSKSAAVAPKPRPVAAAPGLSSMTVTLALKGDFTSLQLFLAQIEKLDRAFVVDSVTVSPIADAGTSAKKEKSATTGLTVAVAGRVFVNSGVVAPAPPVRTAAATSTEK